MVAGVVTQAGQKAKGKRSSAAKGDGELRLDENSFEELLGLQSAEERLAVEMGLVTDVIDALLEHQQVLVPTLQSTESPHLALCVCVCLRFRHRCAGNAALASCTMFESCSQEWQGLADACNTLDVLSSLAAFAATADGPNCMPTFAMPAPGATSCSPSLHIEGMWHPALAHALGSSPVTNNVTLGGGAQASSNAAALLLTGPNMVRRLTCSYTWPRHDAIGSLCIGSCCFSHVLLRARPSL